MLNVLVLISVVGFACFLAVIVIAIKEIRGENYYRRLNGRNLHVDSLLPPINQDVTEETKLIHLRRWSAMLPGDVTVALCGKTYRFNANDADKRPMCDTCLHLMTKLELLYGENKK